MREILKGDENTIYSIWNSGLRILGTIVPPARVSLYLTGGDVKVLSALIILVINALFEKKLKTCFRCVLCHKAFHPTCFTAFHFRHALSRNR
jgi:hypothetical protein